VDISAIAADSAELYEPVAEEVGLTLIAEVEQGISLNGNRELIGQALTNLIDNAIKYSSESDGEKRIRVSLARKDQKIVLSVSDDGPGVPADKRGEVKKRFVRLDESRSKPGTGLGLSLVEAVMELHGGTLELSDTNPLGAACPGLTVSMVFPVSNP
jgi:signal transduction histidine kinase